jgi:hypothetical protein
MGRYCRVDGYTSVHSNYQQIATISFTILHKIVKPDLCSCGDAEMAGARTLQDFETGYLSTANSALCVCATTEQNKDN